MKKTSLMFMLVLAFGSTAASAETVYLKDGTVVRGRITRVDETAIMIESGDSWKQIDRSTIELIKPDEAKSYTPASAADGPARTIEPERRREGPGVYIGIQVPYTMIGGDFDNTARSEIDPGIGIGAIFGYSFNQYLALEIDMAGSSHQSDWETIAFTELSLNMKCHLLPDRDKVRPFLFAGVGSFVLGDKNLMFGGYGYNLGLGLDIPVFRTNTIGITVMQKLITYDEILEGQQTLTGTIDGDATSIRLDVTHHF